MRGADLRVPEFRVIGRLRPGSLDDADEAVRALHGRWVAISAQHHHFGCIRNRCRSGTPGQRDLSLLVRNQILVERSHDRIGSFRTLRSWTGGPEEKNRDNECVPWEAGIVALRL